MKPKKMDLKFVCIYARDFFWPVFWQHRISEIAGFLSFRRNSGLSLGKMLEFRGNFEVFGQNFAS